MRSGRLSEFTAAAFRAWLPPDAGIVVRIVPIPVAVAPPTPSTLGRADFGLPDAAVIVLVSFSLASSNVRKNPLGAMQAFRAAFGDRADRILLLKIGNPGHFPAEFAGPERGGGRLFRISASKPAPCRAADSHALTACADIVLSLHRSEGFGLVPAEAMLLGRPVVATGWSGNMDFMDADSAALVGYRLVPARDPRGVFEAPGAVWAEPDLDRGGGGAAPPRRRSRRAGGAGRARAGDGAGPAGRRTGRGGAARSRPGSAGMRVRA